MVARVVARVGGDGRHLPSVPDLPEPDLLAELVGVHDHGEDVHAGLGHRLSGAPGYAVSLGDDLGLSGRYDVPPVGVDADAEHTGVKGPQFVRVEEPQARVVGDEGVQLGVRVVGLEHVEAWSVVGVQRVTGLRRVIEALRTNEREKDYEATPSLRFILFFHYYSRVVRGCWSGDFLFFGGRPNYRHCGYAV